MARTTCVACGIGSLQPLLRIDAMPVLCGVVWPAKAGALEAVTGELDLYICPECGLVYNVAFDASLIEYEGDYDISAHFSAFFHSYVDELVARLSSRYELKGKHIVEIGCGKGEFLTALCQASGSTGVGYDRSYAGESDGVEPGVSFRREYYGPQSSTEPVDFIVCRHVLEHIHNPLEFLLELRAVIGDRSVACYFEMPDARFVFTDPGIWDLIYPHVSYYGPAALHRLLQRAGFTVADLGSSFGGQYLWAIATTGQHLESSAADIDGQDSDAVAAFVAQAHAVAASYATSVATWQQDLRRIAAGPQEVLLWGAGTKGASFLCAVGADLIDAVVDVNPRKRGRFLPLSGAEVIGPDDVRGRSVGTVLVANPAYSAEIGRQLDDLGVRTTLMAI